MDAEVAIIGVGWSGFRPISPDLSYKEMMFAAAVAAYSDAGIDARRDIDGFVTAAEDFHEGTAIFDEYVPDQLGGALKPVHTIAGEGLHALAAAYMNIATGLQDIVVVEGHSKASNILTLPQITAYALDPVTVRPLDANPLFIAGLEMRAFLHATETTAVHCAAVVAKNRRNALLNPSAAYGAEIGVDTVLRAAALAEPLTALQVAEHADGAIVMVLASGNTARTLSERPIWIRGIGWANDAFALDSRAWEQARYAEHAADMAYRVAGVRSPLSELDFAEVDDTFAYKELQHLEALRLARPGHAGPWTTEGSTELSGEFPVNVSGGSLGVGHLLDASGLARALEAVVQLRGEAGARQIPNAESGLVFGWRGLPTTGGVAAVLSL
jgi:acetyl-CoA C-acetyltransferase